MTDKQWCDLMGITPRTLQLWKNQPEFDASLKAAIEEMEESADPFATCARAFALEQMVKQYTKADTGNDQRQYLKLIMDNTAHVAQQGDAVSYDDLSDDDLVALCLDRGVTPAGMTQEELRRLAVESRTEGSDGTGADLPRPEGGKGKSKTARRVSGVGVEKV